MREVTQTEMLEFEKKKVKITSSKKNRVSAPKGSGDAKLAKQSKQNPSNAKPTVKASTIYTPDAKKNTIISAARKTAALVGQSDKVTASSLGFKSTANIRSAASQTKPSSPTSSGGTSSKPSPTDRGILQDASNLVDGLKSTAQAITTPVTDIVGAALSPVSTMSKIIDTGREALVVGRSTDSQSSNLWNIFGKDGEQSSIVPTQTSNSVATATATVIPNKVSNTGAHSMDSKKIIGGAVILGIAGAYLFALRKNRRSYGW